MGDGGLFERQNEKYADFIRIQDDKRSSLPSAL